MASIGRYILIGIVSSFLLLLALSINNMLWVTASPEWDTQFIVSNSINHWVGPVNEYSTESLFNYLFFYRVVTVWSNWRDILSAVIVGSIIMGLAVVLDRRR